MHILVLIASPLAAFLLALMLIPALRKVALRIGLVDKPNHRKVHRASIPLVGGVAIFSVTSLVLGLALPFGPGIVIHPYSYLAVTVLLLMGVIDDRFDLRASLKLAIQLVLAHFMYTQGVKIDALHGLFGLHELDEWAQYVLTLVIITGVVNAFNLMDGIDGLAAGLALVACGLFATLALMTHQDTLALIFLTYAGALLAFLRFNLSQGQKVFMGDAGSLMMGFVLVVSGIHMMQAATGTPQISLVALGVVAVMLVPVFDALRVFRKRVKSGKSPFSADKTHLHHLILAMGLPHKTAALGIVGLMLFIMALGFMSFHLVGLTVAIVAMLALFYVVTSLLQFHHKISYWKERISQMENA